MRHATPRPLTVGDGFRIGFGIAFWMFMLGLGWAFLWAFLVMFDQA